MVEKMSNGLRILLIIVSLVLLIIVLRLIAKNKLPIKYSLFWIVSCITLLLVGIFPKVISFFKKVAGFETSSNLVIGIFLVILLGVTLLLTIIVSDQKKKITLLTQELSILKSKVDS
jgi:hypothetical protein